MPRLFLNAACTRYASPALGRHGGTEIESLVVQLKLNFTRTGGPRASQLSEYLYIH